MSAVVRKLSCTSRSNSLIHFSDQCCVSEQAQLPWRMHIWPLCAAHHTPVTVHHGGWFVAAMCTCAISSIRAGGRAQVCSKVTGHPLWYSERPYFKPIDVTALPIIRHCPFHTTILVYIHISFFIYFFLVSKVPPSVIYNCVCIIFMQIYSTYLNFKSDTWGLFFQSGVWA